MVDQKLEALNSVKEGFKTYLQVFEERKNEKQYWYYDINTKEFLQGANVLPHEDDSKYLVNLLYIGDDQRMDFLKKYGITELHQKSISYSKIATIGKNPENGHWFCWSHRGHGEFYIGKVVEKDTLLSQAFAAGYIPQTEEHCMVMAMVFQDYID